MRDWLIPHVWRSATVVETVPDGAKYVGHDRGGWAYYSDGRHIFTIHH